MNNKNNQRKTDLEYLNKIEKNWNNDNSDLIDKLKAFTKFVPYTEFPKLFLKYELFKSIINVHGSIIECGVYQGSGIFTWAILSSIFEPVNHIRKIVGFDSFEGFTSVDKNDSSLKNPHLKKGGLKYTGFENLLENVKCFDSVRPLGHINKIELIKGDANFTIKSYKEDNPELVIALLYLDFDLYEPTKNALIQLYDLVPKGGIIVFDELANKDWPGETIAFKEMFDLKDIELKRFPFHPQISYFIK